MEWRREAGYGAGGRRGLRRVDQAQARGTAIPEGEMTARSSGGGDSEVSIPAPPCSGVHGRTSSSGLEVWGGSGRTLESHGVLRRWGFPRSLGGGCELAGGEVVLRWASGSGKLGLRERGVVGVSWNGRRARDYIAERRGSAERVPTAGLDSWSEDGAELMARWSLATDGAVGRMLSDAGDDGRRGSSAGPLRPVLHSGVL